MEIVLVEPEIPQNTGNIARTCAATNTPLTLIRPLGFSLSDRQLKRSGLDYFSHVQIQVLDSLEECLSQKKRPFYFFSTKATTLYTDISFDQESLLIFGSESKGLASWIHEKYKKHFCTIPLHANMRSLNLSNAVSIALYEALRQQGFASLL